MTLRDQYREVLAGEGFTCIPHRTTKYECWSDGHLYVFLGTRGAVRYNFTSSVAGSYSVTYTEPTILRWFIRDHQAKRGSV